MNEQPLHGTPGEKRTGERFRIQAPAIARVGKREIWAFTRDISARAVYFKTAGEEMLPAGQNVEFLIKIPPSMSYSKPCFIKGRGRTIRLDELNAELSGFVVEITEYDIKGDSVQDDDDPWAAIKP